MANYEINLTATQIESALNKAHAPATVVDNTQNLVESGAIKTYVDTQVSAGASITTESFAGSALETSNDGLTATDDAVPTSAAVVDYVNNNALGTVMVVFNNHVNNTNSASVKDYTPVLSAVSSLDITVGAESVSLPNGTYIYSLPYAPVLDYRNQLFLNDLRIKQGSGWNSGVTSNGLTGLITITGGIIRYGSVDYTGSITFSRVLLSLYKVS
jgi:hypothetical protein